MVKSQEYHRATKKPLAIIAPLDWGLGHTTRCIPIIRELLVNKFDIVIACDSAQKAVLQDDFPDAQFVHLRGYGLKYGKSRASTLLRLVLQMPKILISIKRENLQFKRIINQFRPNIIISDNRYGVFSSSIYSIFITHQLNIITGAGTFADYVVKRATHNLIGRFNECWIPDFSGSFNLAGALSHPLEKPAFPIRYIGALSRFKSCADNELNAYRSSTAAHGSDSAQSSIDLLVILSGPEPQRTKLESILLTQLARFTGRVTLVRGLTLEKILPVATVNIRVINYAGSKELNALICKAKLVVCRSGYTSVMDLVKLGKNAILIPTPGQAEQEYLAGYLGDKKMAVIAYQDKLNILSSITLTESLQPPRFESMDDYKKVIRELAEQVINSSGSQKTGSPF